MVGTALSQSDLLQVLDATRACAEAEDLQQFADRIVDQLPGLVPCDHAAYNEVNTGAGMSWGRVNPPDVLRPEWYEVLTHYGHENPLIPHGMAAPNDAPRSWSEMATLTELRRTNLYNLMYRHLDVTDQLAGIVAGGAHLVAGAVVARSSVGFSDRDRTVLDLFRRQLAATRRHLEAATRLRATTAGSGMAIVALSHSGAVTSITGDAELAATLGLGRVDGATSPLRAWVLARQARGDVEPAARRIAGPPTAVWVRHVPGFHEDVVVLGEQGRGDGDGDNTETWHVRLLGSFALWGASGPVRLEGKTADVVKMLAVSERPMPVDEIVEQLWPDVSIDVGRRRLRGVLYRLPHDPNPVVGRRGDALVLAPGVVIDAADFETAARRATSAARRGDDDTLPLGEAALAHYPADLLPEDLYVEWPAARREQLRRRRLDLLDALASHAEATGAPDRAAALLADAVAADPVDEPRQLRLARLYAATGRRAAALNVMQHAVATTAELGLPPAPEWEALRITLRT